MHEDFEDPNPYITRSLEPVVARAAAEFPVVVLVGPRQSGKTTLLRHLFGEARRVVSLDLPDVREAASADPRGFLDLYPPPVVFDEVQQAPGLLPYIRARVDAQRDRPGQYLLTGSQNLLMMERVTESLAGRAAVLQLLPLTWRELAHSPNRPFPWEITGPPQAVDTTPVTDLWETILRGFYPEIARDPGRDGRLWQASYVQTYLERDVRGLRNVGDLGQFQSFLRALAARATGLLNLSDIAGDIGIAVSTARDWLSILEATFQVFKLRPYHANLGKRLVKSPKVYFTDTGLLAYLVGLRDPVHAAAGPMGGPLFENLVVAEVHKTFLHRGEEPPLHFWRTAAGDEVDLLVDDHGVLIPIEIKASATPRQSMATTIHRFRRDLGAATAAGYVVHAGGEALPLGDGTLALPVGAL